MNNLIDTVERFLTYSDEKLEQLNHKNQSLKEEARFSSTRSELPD